MFGKNLKPVPLSFPKFLRNLNYLLLASGIIPSQLPILAENDQKKSKLSPPSDAGVPSRLIGHVIIYMEDHLAEELTLEELAGEVSLSKYQLIRRFKDEEGITPWKFLMRKRIKKVQELLEEGISPGQAAAETGFYDQSHLNKVFREKTGLTPKEYQEQNFRNNN